MQILNILIENIMFYGILKVDENFKFQLLLFIIKIYEATLFSQFSRSQFP